MEKINYKSSTLKLVDDLSEISKTRDGYSSIKFTKDLEGIHVRSRNESKTIMFTLDAPSDNLSIGSELCIYNYSEFYKYLTTIGTPDIYFGIVNEGTDTETEAIVLQKGNRKVTYPVSDSEVIAGHFTKLREQEISTSFKFTSENLQQFKKVLSLIQSKSTKIRMVFSGKVAKVFIFSEDSNNTYEDSFDLLSEVEEEFTMVIQKDFFKYLINTNYDVQVSDVGGYLKFAFDLEDNKCAVVVTSDDE